MIGDNSRRRKVMSILAASTFVIGILLVAMPSRAKAEPLSMLVHRGDPVVMLNCTQHVGDWSNFPTYLESTTGTEISLRHDGANLYIMVRMPAATPAPQDYWGIEFDNNGDQAHMGTSSSPDDAIFASTGCPSVAAKDAYLTGFAQPKYDQDRGGINDADGLMSWSDGEYMIHITRPLVTGDSVGRDADLSMGVKIGVGFVAGTFGQGAAHKGTDMSTYVLSISNETSSGGGTVTLVQQNYYNFANTMGQWLFIGTMGLCVFHFIRRRAWRWRPYESAALEATPLAFAEVERHDAGMRFSHWAHVVLMTGLLITGLSIHDKSYLLGKMTTPVHLVFAFSILFIDFPVHFVAMWRGGDMKNIFTPRKDDIKVAVGTTANFFFLSKKYPEHATWDPKTKSYYMDRKYCSYQKYLLYGDIVSIIIMGVTGIALYWPGDMQWLTSFIGGPANIRALHLFIFYYFAASVIAHMYLSFIPSNIGRLDAMITGKGKIRMHTEAEESRVIISTPGAVAHNGGGETPPRQ